ncbi:MAG: polysaccharide deacetylase family protein [Saprospiraceae bacterium]|nr:polysaccharide deacetylase family protein [Saprospiraceae bacterium]
MMRFQAFLLYGIFVVLVLFVVSYSDRPATDIDKPLVVLTFDDAVKSHRTFVAPLLVEYGFNATFFVTYAWMTDTVNFMTWEDIAELDSMGFEIGNHSWTHSNFSQPKAAFELEGELGMIEWLLKQHGIPKPVSYAHTGNAFGPKAVQALKRLEYRYARRGKQPEVAYGKLDAGPGYDPQKHHPLLIPTTIDFYPDMTFPLFKEAMSSVKTHEIVVLQFHGVPDIAHPWVSTSQDNFKKYMNYLDSQNYQVIAMKELDNNLLEDPPNDPMLGERFPPVADDELSWPLEVMQTREKEDFWVKNMQRHQYSYTETAEVLGQHDSTIHHAPDKKSLDPPPDLIEVLPFPGGRHPRLDFKEGMLSPMRGTKLSVFLPWDSRDYVVLDIPEAVFTQYGLTFLGHKHIPTVFDYSLNAVSNSDWKKDEQGNWTNIWLLDRWMEIKATVTPEKERVLMQLSLTNNTDDTIFHDLQTQVCVMLGKAANFSEQTNDNKQFNCPVAVVQSKKGNQWIVTAWEGCSNPWGNADCPCLHADPKFPDCSPGQTVSIKGMLWFYTGNNIQAEIDRVRSELDWL